MAELNKCPFKMVLSWPLSNLEGIIYPTKVLEMSASLLKSCRQMKIEFMVVKEIKEVSLLGAGSV
jgi:hypothetical protein